MNKLLVAAIAGVLFSLIIAFIVLYATSYYYTFSISNDTLTRNNIKMSDKTPPIYVLNNINSNIKALNAILAGLNGTITSYNVTYALTQTSVFVSPQSHEKNVFFIQPNFIVATPNSTISFKLYFNITYYKLYNDSIYTDQISDYLYNFKVVQLNQSLNGFILYNVTAQVGNIKPGTLILLPIWDTKFFEIQYIIVLIN